MIRQRPARRAPRRTEARDDEDPDLRARGLLGTRRSAKKTGASGRALIAAPVAFALMTVGAMPDARAQYHGGGDAFTAIFVAGAVLEGGAAIGGLVTGIGSTVHAAQGSRSRGWFVSSYVFGGLNLVGALAWGAIAENHYRSPVLTSLSLAHASLAVFDLVMPTIGFLGSRPEQQARFTPVLLSGLDAGGRRWNGAGLRLSHF